MPNIQRFKNTGKHENVPIIIGEIFPHHEGKYDTRVGLI